MITLAEFKPVDGVVDIAQLIAVTPATAKAGTAFSTARNESEAIDTSGLLAPVQGAVVKLQHTIAKSAAAVNSLNRAVAVLPAMLGAQRPRNYLLLFQNPAELRSSGGISGALALVHTENGRVQMVQQAASYDFPHCLKSVIPLSAETRRLYGDITGEYIQEVNLTPKFAEWAALAREMWRQQFGLTVDGVLSIDPLALSYLLNATGSITLPTGDVMASTNAVKLLLSDA